MRFGLFGGTQAGAPGGPMGSGFREWIEFNVEAEALGYESAFLVEHHFSGWNQVSATLTLLTWLAARTSTLRLGTATMVLPWHNPIILAEQAATLDLLSDGRLDFGVGKGYRHNEYTGFGVPREEAAARFEEALDLIVRAWTTNGRFSHQGRYWSFEDIIVEPPAYQQPHPPIWMGAGSAESIRRVAERGYNLLLDQFATVETTGERVALFRAAAAACGRAPGAQHIALARDMAVVRSEQEKRAVIDRNNKAHERILSVARAPDRKGGSHILAYDHAFSETEKGTLIGTPDEIAAKLEALRRAGVDYVIMSCGNSRESLRRFAREIMPAFASLPAEAPAASTASQLGPAEARMA
jgi:alkanesulfonate monooxygenase SsuD/methylene tetrahydromethanopterin reductase-like flavin-dependent oxidoreductase (luciferase family)